MYNVFHNHDKIERLQSIMEHIAHTGTISMESADAIEREIPGAIHSIDPDIMFDLEESEEGVGVAMEASLTGMSRVKIAFIIAVMAFIAKYIMSLTGATSYSASGGGSGGWAGGASPGFSTDKPATSTQHHQEVDAYDHALNEDLKKLHDEFSETFKEFSASILDNSTGTGMFKNASMKKLCNQILPRIIKENRTTTDEQTGSQKGFTVFNNGQGGKNALAMKQLKDFLEIDDVKADVNSGQFKSIKPILSIIDKEYTIRGVFINGYTGMFKNAINLKNYGMMGFALPFFILSKEIQTHTLEFVKLLNTLVANTDKTTQELDDFKNILKPADQGKPDMLVSGQESKDLWAWLAKNLGKDSAPSATVLRGFLDGVIKLLELEKEQGQYINTPHINIEMKKFVRASIDGAGITEEDGIDKIFSEMPSGDEERTIKLLAGENSNILELLNPILPLFEEVSETLKENENNFNTLKNVATDLEELMRNVIEWIKNAPKLNDKLLSSGTSLDSRGRDRLAEYDEDAPPEKQLKNIVPMFSLVSGLIQIVLLSMASAAKYNVELSRFSKARLDLIIAKKQAMAKDLHDLNIVMKNIIKESI